MAKKNTDKNKEKRKYERIDFVQATYFKLADGESGIDECFLNNISTGGLSFDTKDRQLNIGDDIIIMYKVGTQLRRDNLRIKHVDRVFNNWRCGGKFLEDDFERDDMIRKYIENQNLRND
jgi:hypothetical protein